MPTPAENAAARKKPRRPHGSGTPRVVRWRCGARALRRELGLSLRDVGARTGVSISALSNAERGCEPTLTHALAVARFFGTTVEALWKPIRGKT